MMTFVAADYNAVKILTGKVLTHQGVITDGLQWIDAEGKATHTKYYNPHLGWFTGGIALAITFEATGEVESVEISV